MVLIFCQANWQQLNTNQSQIRLLAMRLFDYFFSRSVQVRKYLVGRINDFFRLCLGTVPDEPLPEPKFAADMLRDQTMVVLERWRAQWGTRYPPLEKGCQYLSRVAHLRFPDVIGAENRRRQHEADEYRQAESHFQRAQREYEDLLPSITGNLATLENTFELLIPRVESLHTPPPPPLPPQPPQLLPSLQEEPDPNLVLAPPLPAPSSGSPPPTGPSGSVSDSAAPAVLLSPRIHAPQPFSPLAVLPSSLSASASHLPPLALPPASLPPPLPSPLPQPLSSLEDGAPRAPAAPAVAHPPQQDGLQPLADSVVASFGALEAVPDPPMAHPSVPAIKTDSALPLPVVASPAAAPPALLPAPPPAVPPPAPVKKDPTVPLPPPPAGVSIKRDAPSPAPLPRPALGYADPLGLLTDPADLAEALANELEAAAAPLARVTAEGTGLVPISAVEVTVTPESIAQACLSHPLSGPLLETATGCYRLLHGRHKPALDQWVHWAAGWDPDRAPPATVGGSLSPELRAVQVQQHNQEKARLLEALVLLQARAARVLRWCEEAGIAQSERLLEEAARKKKRDEEAAAAAAATASTRPPPSKRASSPPKRVPPPLGDAEERTSFELKGAGLPDSPPPRPGSATGSSPPPDVPLWVHPSKRDPASVPAKPLVVNYSKKEDLLKVAPYIPPHELPFFGLDRVSLHSSGLEVLHRFMGGDAGEGSVSTEEMRRIWFTVKPRAPSAPIPACRAPLKNGGLCPRRDLTRCPFHGLIVPRDDQGRPIPPPPAQTSPPPPAQGSPLSPPGASSSSRPSPPPARAASGAVVPSSPPPAAAVGPGPVSPPPPLSPASSPSCPVSSPPPWAPRPPRRAGRINVLDDDHDADDDGHLDDAGKKNDPGAAPPPGRGASHPAAQVDLSVFPLSPPKAALGSPLPSLPLLPATPRHLPAEGPAADEEQQPEGVFLPGSQGDGEGAVADGGGGIDEEYGEEEEEGDTEDDGEPDGDGGPDGPGEGGLPPGGLARLPIKRSPSDRPLRLPAGSPSALVAAAVLQAAGDLVPAPAPAPEGASRGRGGRGRGRARRVRSRPSESQQLSLGEMRAAQALRHQLRAEPLHTDWLRGSLQLLPGQPLAPAGEASSSPGEEHKSGCGELHPAAPRPSRTPSNPKLVRISRPPADPKERLERRLTSMRRSSQAWARKRHTEGDDEQQREDRRVRDAQPITALPPAELPGVSVILPCRNESRFLRCCLDSIIAQDYLGPIELSFFDDASEDDSVDIFLEWFSWVASGRTRGPIADSQIGGDLIPSPPSPGLTKGGIGFARNRAVNQSHQPLLVMQDCDDYSMPSRIRLEVEAHLAHPGAIVGSRFVRDPPGSTPRYVDWCNRITQEQLMLQRFRECSIIQPTWLLSRRIFAAVGGYDESRPVGVPEDLIFYFRHLALGGDLFRVDQPLVAYRYHPGQTSFTVEAKTIFDVRVQAIEAAVLSKWERFVIWGLGKEGKAFYKQLSPPTQRKVTAFCDVAASKVGQTYINMETGQRIPVVHYLEAQPPLVCCVKLDLTNGEFERNLASKGLQEGVDFFLFS
ncbi:putative B3gntl1 protein [Paratrimastix pyriformis]|uniref:B3gntl1 protein n=1 Tax=Paratrimastix pyriformis TaxID=342808 RepID=A0ABQ8UX81_9EUKA|nr:putative B3gntl1 protein [Paratrimastix pyriformis]